MMCGWLNRRRTLISRFTFSKTPCSLILRLLRILIATLWFVISFTATEIAAKRVKLIFLIREDKLSDVRFFVQQLQAMEQIELTLDFAKSTVAEVALEAVVSNLDGQAHLNVCGWWKSYYLIQAFIVLSIDLIRCNACV